MTKVPASVMLCGFTLMVLMLVYPPWVLQDSAGEKYPMGYGFIWDPPIRRVEVPGLVTKWFDVNLSEVKPANSIDINRLLVQEGIVLVIMLAMVAITRNMPRQKSSET